MKYAIAALAVLSAAPGIAQSSSTSVSSTPNGSSTTVTTAATATTPAATTTVTTTPKGTSVKTTATDPKTKLICQYTETLGTRLGGHKVCKTRDEWRQSVEQDRAAVDHAQVSRGILGN